MLTDSELEKYGVWIKSGPISIELPQQTSHENVFVSQKDEFVQAMGTHESENPRESRQMSDLTELAEHMQSEISALREEIQKLKSSVIRNSFILEDNTSVLTDDTDEDIHDSEDDDREILELDTLEEDDDSDIPEVIPAEEKNDDKKKRLSRNQKF